jgi:tetratricopeptide (TPR) repeat protein
MDQEHRSLTALGSVLIATLLLAGCPASPQRPDSGNAPNLPVPVPVTPGAIVPSPAPPAPTPAPPPPRENHLSPATRSLVNQAHTLMGHGDLDGASSALDRAVRIEPNNPLVWIEVGRLRLAENDAHQAESGARKALALASGDRGTQAQAGRVLADALRAQGRNPEALEVERQPYMH